MTPLAIYQDKVDSGELDADPNQLAAVTLLQSVYDELLQHPLPHPRARQTGLLSRIFRSSNTPVKVQGVYLWGGVGRGKTMLTDMFYATVPIAEKKRIHFHRFMQQIHNELRALGEVENPLSLIADKWIKEVRLLVLDEMHVNDITDAMLIGGLLTALFERGMTMVTTSNVIPDDLYKEGLQRSRFIPAIEQIKAHTKIHALGGDLDYRLRVLENVDIWFDSEDQSTLPALNASFTQLAAHESVNEQPVSINGRDIPVVRRAETVVWFEFDTLCNTPRSTSDYIEIATVFNTVFISNIEVLNNNRNDEARRLVNLVDELYDRNVKLVISANAEPEALYIGERLSFEFVRAASRLREMQTREYLSREHL